jgi:hypothetical protein
LWVVEDLFVHREVRAVRRMRYVPSYAGYRSESTQDGRVIPCPQYDAKT